MNTLYKSVLVLTFCVTGLSVQAQDWREMVTDPNTNFRDIQTSFYSEFGDKIGGKGTGWKQFKRWEWFMEPRIAQSGKRPNQKLIYEEVKLEIGYRVDLLVENRIIVEIKSIEALADIHLAQILTYMKLSKCKLGLLVNFNVPHLKNGIKRVIL